MIDVSGCKTVKTLFFLLLTLTLPIAVFPQDGADALEFANSLMADGDYFRAITEYKRIIFYSDGEDLKKRCTYEIALAYLKSNHFSLSLSYLDMLMKFPQLPAVVFVKTDLLYGINFYFLHENGLAREYFDKSTTIDSSGTPELFLGLLSAEKGEWESASRIFKIAAGKSGDTESGILAASLATDVLKGSTLDSRSPFLAGLFSAVLPGSGQAYTGHWFDGLNSFTMVGLFGFATYLAFSYESQRNNGSYVYTAISGIITGFFYFSNIIGAARTAEYYTVKQRQDFLDGIGRRIFDTVP